MPNQSEGAFLTAAEQVIAEGGEVQKIVEQVLLQTDNAETVKIVQKLARMIGTRADRLSSTVSLDSSVTGTDSRQEVS